MKTNDKQYYIYLRATKERVPCTEEEFRNYYRDIDTFRKKQQRHGRCVCPESKRLDCDMDCATCPFSRAGDGLSLDYTVTDEDGNEKSWLDDLEDPTAHTEDLFTEKAELQRLFIRLTEIMPDAITIGTLREDGLTDTQISKTLGIRQNTMHYRLKRAKEILREEFPDFF